MKLYNPFRPHLVLTSANPARFGIRRWTLWGPGWEYRDFSSDFWWGRRNKNFKDCETFDIKRARNLLNSVSYKPKRLDDVDLAKFLLMQEAHPPEQDADQPERSGMYGQWVHKTFDMAKQGVALPPMASPNDALQREFNRIQRKILHGMPPAPINTRVFGGTIHADSRDA